MKFVFYALMIPGAFFLGKVLYSPMFEGGGSEETAVESVVEIKVKSPMGTITETIDYHDIDPKDYPEKVTLADATILTDKNGLSPLKLDPGSPAKPLALAEMMLEVTSPLASHLTGEISVLDTDFAEGVAKKRMERRVAMADAASVESKPVAPAPAPANESTPKTPEVAVAPTPSTPPAMDEGSPTEEPEPAPAPEPAATESLSNEQIIAAMKASLEEGKIKELDASKVTNWEAIGDESFDGVEFQVGVATYKEMTILGEKSLQAKALFKKGQLEKWIHSKTGMEIR